MRKFLIFAALAVSAAAHSAQQASSNAQVDLDGRGRGIWKVSITDASGTPVPTPTGGVQAISPTSSPMAPLPVTGRAAVDLTTIIGTAATSYFDKLTATAVDSFASLTTMASNVLSSLNVFKGATSTAAPFYTINATVLGLSNTSRSLSAPTSINLTTVAGLAIPCTTCFGTVGNTTVGFRWRITGSSSWPNGFHFYAVSTTPICRDKLAPGMHLHLSPSSATDITGTVEIDVESETLR